MITVMNSRMLIEIKSLSLLSHWWMRVLSTTSVEKTRCHKNCRGIDKPPPASRQLSPKIFSKGVRMITNTIGDFYTKPELSLTTSWRISISAHIVLLVKYSLVHMWTKHALLPHLSVKSAVAQYSLTAYGIPYKNDVSIPYFSQAHTLWMCRDGTSSGKPHRLLTLVLPTLQWVYSN